MNADIKDIKIKKVYEIVYSALIMLYLILKPFYFFKSGLPQISDFIIVFAFSIVLFSGRLYINKINKTFVLWNFIFIAYICCINGVWAVFLGGELELLKYSLYYIFNFAVVITCINFYNLSGKNALRIILIGMLISIMLQLLMMLTIKQISDTRQTLFFNNPNQLGYFGVLSISLIIILFNKIKCNINILILSLLGTFFLVLISLSKAAIISAGLMLFTFFIYNFRNKKFIKILLIYILIISIFVLLLIALDMNYDNKLKLYEAIARRLSSIGIDKDDNLGGRGYDRIFNHPRYLVFGAGEGLTTRFTSEIQGEIHSTLGSLLFSYGIFGLLIFIVILCLSIKSKKSRSIYPLLFIFLYGLTHNGIRQSMLWMIIVLIEMFESNQ